MQSHDTQQVLLKGPGRIRHGGYKGALVSLSLVLCCAATAVANDNGASTAGIQAQTSVRVLQPTQSDESSFRGLQKVGEARLKVLLWSIYDSRLYTTSGAYTEGERPLKLELQYLRDIKSETLAQRTLQEWQAMGRNHPRQEAWASSLNDLWPDIQTNDIVSLELDERNVATFLHNNEVLGRIDDPEFGQHFVDIWLSTDCTRPKLRTALLGQSD